MQFDRRRSPYGRDVKFVFHGLDRPDSAELRRELRASHVEHQSQNPVGGPLLDDVGEPCGTVIILERETLADAEAFMADDPYVVAGLFATSSLRRFHAVDWPT